MVTRAKEDGGLGILDLKTQNEALLLKHLHKIFNRADIPWVHLVWEKHYSNGKLPSHTKKGSFWWRDILKLLDKFKGLASVQASDGASCLFWDDCWVGQPLKLSFPELFSFAKKPSISLRSVIYTTPSNLFNLPLSVEAYAQFQEVQEALQVFSPTMLLIPGFISGEVSLSLPKKLISICWVLVGLHQSSNGFGDLHVNRSIKCSFGS
jgi:hypothetical protein